MSAAVVTISPEVIDVSEKLKSVDPFKRNCFFVDERPLQFFHLYNQMNCAFECIANHTLVECGCVKFSMPRMIDTKICDESKIECYRRSLMTLYDQYISFNFAGDFFRLCQCLPSCTSIDYQVGLTNVPINYFPIKMNFMRDK